MSSTNKRRWMMKIKLNEKIKLMFLFCKHNCSYTTKSLHGPPESISVDIGVASSCLRSEKKIHYSLFDLFHTKAVLCFIVHEENSIDLL